jgi:uncharacterized membrane protein
MAARERSGDGVGGLTRALGVASLGLGVAQVAAPRRVARAAGVDDVSTAPTVIRAVGARELVHATGLLRNRRPRGWAYTRVAGDALDLAVLGLAARGRSGERRRRALLASGAVLGITAADVYAARRARRSRQARPLHVTATVTVNAPPREAYAFWRDFANFPSFMAHVGSVQVDGMRSRWTATAPAGGTVTWEAEITQDSPNRLVSWRSVEGSTVPNSGTVTFTPAPAGHGTEIRVELDYELPAGRLGALVAKLFGEEPEQQVRDDLRRAKQVLETGDVVRSDGSPDGTKARRQAAQHRAQPELVNQ